MLSIGHSPQTTGLAVLGEEEEGRRRAHGKMEKWSSEGRKEEAEEGNKGLRKATDGGLGTQRCGLVPGEWGADGNPPADPGPWAESSSDTR